MPVDAAPLPPGCKPHKEGMPSSCKSEATWTKYVTSACTQMGLPAVLSVTFQQPCGPGLYSHASAICCPASDPTVRKPPGAQSRRRSLSHVSIFDSSNTCAET